MTNKQSPSLFATIDIGATSVKAVVIENNDSKKRLLYAESEKLKPNSEFADEKDYRQHISAAIKNLVIKLRLNRCQKIISLFYNRELQVKIIDLPSQVNKEQLDKVLSWEAKKLLSPNYKDEKFCFAYGITRESPISLALSVIPQPLLEAHLNLFNDTGIEPDSIYADVFAAQALNPIVDIAGLPAISIVNFGYSGTHLQIFSTGKLKFYRFIPTGTAEMSNPPKENELEMYSQKIRFSFDYFRAVSKLNQVDNLYFIGGGSEFDEVIPFAQNYFSPTKAYPLDISSEIDISPVMSSRLNQNSESSKNLLAYVPAIGACLAGLKKNADKMDLTYQLRSIANAQKKERMAKILPLIFSLLGIVVALTMAFHNYSLKANRLESIEQELAIKSTELTPIKEEIAKLVNKNKSSIKLSQESMKLIEPIINSGNPLEKLFDKALTHKDSGIAVTEILIRNLKEAEIVALPINTDKSNKENLEGIVTEKASPFVSKLMCEISEDFIKDDFKGNVAIIYGIADNQITLSNFIESLTFRESQTNKEAALKRYLSISSRKTENSKIEFLLKGEL